MQTARDVMTKEVLTVNADLSLDELAVFLDRHRISGAPVLEDEAMVGVVSIRDLARVWHDRPSVKRSMRVRDVMTPVVFSVHEQTELADVAETMVRGRIHRVVVLRGRSPVGIVSSLDLLRLLQRGFSHGSAVG